MENVVHYFYNVVNNAVQKQITKKILCALPPSTSEEKLVVLLMYMSLVRSRVIGVINCSSY